MSNQDNRHKSLCPNLILVLVHRPKFKSSKMGNWIPKCMSTMITTVMSTYFAPAPAFDEKPLLFDVELLQRYQRLRENGKFLDLEIKCSDGSTRFVHKFVLNSLSVKLGRAIQESKYIPHIYQFSDTQLTEWYQYFSESIFCLPPTVFIAISIATSRANYDFTGRSLLIQTV